MANINELTREATALMDEHGLFNLGWSFAWDNARQRGGLCKYSVKTITVSRNVARLNDSDWFVKVLLHEIAHALVGPGHGHDRVWRAMLLRIGGDGQRCHTGQTQEGRFVGTCPNGHSFTRLRRSKGMFSGVCARCYKRGLKVKFAWVDKVTKTHIYA